MATYLCPDCGEWCDNDYVPMYDDEERCPDCGLMHENDVEEAREYERDQRVTALSLANDPDKRWK